MAFRGGSAPASTFLVTVADGLPGQAIAILVDDNDALFSSLLNRDYAITGDYGQCMVGGRLQRSRKCTMRTGPLSTGRGFEPRQLAIGFPSALSKPAIFKVSQRLSQKRYSDKRAQAPLRGVRKIATAKFREACQARRVRRCG
jgi:hypothetical protein